MNGDSAVPNSSSSAEREATVLSIVNVVLRHRRLIVAWALALGVVVAVYTLLSKRTYRSRATFLVQGPSRNMAQFAGLAAQLGVDAGGSGNNVSPEFYAYLLRSREILGDVIEAPFVAVGGGDSTRAPLIDLLKVDSSLAPARRHEEGIKRLSRAVHVSFDRETNLVEVGFSSAWASVSQQVIARVVELVGRFDLERRQTQASAERRFVGERLEEARREAGASEDRLQGFLQRNRDYRSAPGLLFEQQRLQRDVEMREQLLATLAQSYEKARIDEVRNTPVLIVVDRPILAAAPEPRGTVARTFVALVFGACIGLGLAFVREFLTRSAPARGPEETEFRVLAGEAGRPLRGLLRGLRGGGRSAS